MAEIIPALTKETMAHMTNGEKRVAQRLKDLLEDDYLVWFDIPVGKTRRYPDFIVLHPARGLLFLEVKDWKASTLTRIDKLQAQLQVDGKLVKAANPLEQARQCMIQVVNRLKKDPQLLFDANSTYAGKICVPYGYGVIFTEITRKQIKEGISDADREIVLPDDKVIYKDEMTESMDAETFQKQLWNMFQFNLPNTLTLPQIDRIRWHLFPEVRISIQDDLLSEASTDEVQIPDIMKIMDVQQEQLARSMGIGHRVIHGVAGSGKTLILGYRCELLAATTSKPILVLCYNITLAKKLNAIIQAKNIQHRVTVSHFHEWCGAQLRTYHCGVIDGIEEYWERQVLSVIKYVDEGHIPRAQYGAILIDEGHDFDAQWLKLITQMIDPESDSLLLLYDDAQSIYKKRSGLGFSLSSVGIKAQGRTTILRLNYRNTREILDFSYRFAADYMAEHTSDDDHIPLILPESVGRTGPVPTVVQFSNKQAELDHCIASVQAWAKQGVSWNHMAILTSNKYQGERLAKALEVLDIPVYLLGSSAAKKAYNPANNEVSIMTIHSSKGLEFECVIMFGIDELKCADQLADSVRLMYVGMTRAQTHLCLTASSETDITQRLAG